VVNREETKKAIEVMQAYVDGKEVEVFREDVGPEWFPIAFEGRPFSPIWNWEKLDYRIKSKPREFWVPNIQAAFPGNPGDGWIKVREVLDE
jgi:hypothetical protein